MPLPDPHLDALLDALPTVPLRCVAWGMLFGLLLWSALALVILWLWR